MSVKVEVGTDGYGNKVYEDHAAGEDFSVLDGHLFVNGADGYSVAVYAPKTWANAVSKPATS